MRHTYSLTKETLKTFTGHVAEIAEEADVTPQQIHGILAGVNTDPFAAFEHYYKAVCRAHKATSRWDDRLAAIRARYVPKGPPVSIGQCLLDKLTTDAQTSSKLAEAIQDGQVTEQEASQILGLVRAERDVLNRIEAEMLTKFEIGKGARA
jgi:hypothetical protein